MPDSPDVTVILEQWTRGEAGALDRLIPLVYPQLHDIASAYLRRGGRAVTLQTTAVVNELFLKLLARRPEKLENRRHFYILAARIVRMSLVDHCRQAMAQKRGGESNRVPLNDELAWVDATGPEMIELDRSLDALEAMDPQGAELFCMRFLLGCTAEETAELSGVSKATVDRKVKFARAWLFQRLTESKAGDSPNNFV